MTKRRTYILTKGRDEKPKDAYTSFKKIYLELSALGYVPPYHTLYRRFQRAKEKGEDRIFVEVEGETYTIEVHDLK